MSIRSYKIIMSDGPSGIREDQGFAGWSRRARLLPPAKPRNVSIHPLNMYFTDDLMDASSLSSRPRHDHRHTCQNVMSFGTICMAWPAGMKSFHSRLLSTPQLCGLRSWAVLRKPHPNFVRSAPHAAPSPPADSIPSPPLLNPHAFSGLPRRLCSYSWRGQVH
jgi:hypothetical protein